MTQLNIVVPDGSMQKPVTGLFAKTGLPVTIEKPRTKRGAIGVNYIKQVVFQRPQEIPHLLHKGYFDMAIVGEDWIVNWGYDFPVLLKLPIGRGGNKPVKIVLAVSQTSGIDKAEDLPFGSEVATEYVQLTEKFFRGLGRNDIRLTYSFGNTEQKIEYGATAIVDVTESGESLEANELKIIGMVMESHTVIVANPSSLANQEKRVHIERFVRLIDNAFNNKLGPYGDWPVDGH